MKQTDVSIDVQLGTGGGDATVLDLQICDTPVP